MTAQKIKLSVNTHFFDKITKEKRFYREGFDNEELTLEEIAEVINLGCTISYQYRDGIRKSENQKIFLERISLLSTLTRA